MRRRLGLLIAAVIVALFGTGAILAYVHRTTTRVENANAPVDVLVASAQIPSGTTGAVVMANKWAKLQAVPRKNVPAGALVELNDVSAKQLSADVYPGEVLLGQKFSPRPQAQTGALAIPAGKLALSLQLDDPQRVAGFVVPGSQVAVFDTSTSQVGGKTGVTYTGVLLPKVEVIAVGPTTLQPNGTTAAGQQQVAQTILTVAVSQMDAEKLVLAQQTGKLYFGLLSDHSQVSVGGGVVATQLYQ